MISKSSSSNSFDSSSYSPTSPPIYITRKQRHHSQNSLLTIRRSRVKSFQFGARADAILLKTEAIHAVSLLQRFQSEASRFFFHLLVFFLRIRFQLAAATVLQQSIASRTQPFEKLLAKLLNLVATGHESINRFVRIV